MAPKKSKSKYDQACDERRGNFDKTCLCGNFSAAKKFSILLTYKTHIL